MLINSYKTSDITGAIGVNRIKMLDRLPISVEDILYGNNADKVGDMLQFCTESLVQ